MRSHLIFSSFILTDYFIFLPFAKIHFLCLGCEARSDKNGGAGGVLVAPLVFPPEAAGGLALQAADVCCECGADGRALRQRGPSLVHPLSGCARASGLHSGDPSRQGSGPPVVCEPQPADARLAAVPGEGKARRRVSVSCLSLS